MTPVTDLSALSVGIALLAGAASFLSPCVLPLLPGYLSFVSGVSFDELAGNLRRVVLATLAFVLGFSLVFTLAGAGAAFVGAAFLQHRRALELAAGVMLVALGFVLMGVVKFDFLERERKLLPFRPPRGLAGAFLAGIAFSVGWTPCVGPILGSILTMAASRQSPGAGAVLLFAYSLGMGIPFLLAGLFVSKALSGFSWAKRHFRAIKLASGTLVVVYGLLVLTNQLTWLSSRLGGFGLFDF